MKPVAFIGGAQEEMRELPKFVRHSFGHVIYLAQTGDTHPDATPMRGFPVSVTEFRERFEGDAYRLIFTVSFPEAVYVIHAFKKKSKKGIETPKRNIDLISARLQVLVREKK